MPEFTRDGIFTVTFSNHCTKLSFGDGNSYSIPVNRLAHPSNSQMVSQAQVYPTENEPKTKEKKLPTMTLEQGHKILAHRSIRSLITGSLHEVWADYRLIVNMMTTVKAAR